MRKEIERVLEKGIKLDFRDTLLLVNEDLDFPTKDIREATREMDLSTIAIIKKLKNGYCITEIRDSEELSQVFMSLDSYKKKYPRDWIRLKDILKRHYPGILRDIGEYHDIDIYQ